MRLRNSDGESMMKFNLEESSMLIEKHMSFEMLESVLENSLSYGMMCFYAKLHYSEKYSPISQ